MVTFLYQCPTTGQKVQGMLPAAALQNSTQTYQSVSCIACQQLHLVNPETGKALGTGSAASRDRP